MNVVLLALALVSGAVGAGFCSGRELVRFFAAHGACSGAAEATALAALFFLFTRLPAQLSRTGADTLPALCRARFGRRLGAVCAGLFLLLSAVTGGAMLAACAELAALVLPVRGAYNLGLIGTLLAACLLAGAGVAGLALPGAALTALLPALLLRLLALPAGEACFLPAMAPDLPVRAAADGACYGALNAAALCGALPLLASLAPRERRSAALVFSALFGSLLLLGVAAVKRHLPAVLFEPMPFVFLCRALGAGGYYLCAACLYFAALSTLTAMLAALAQPLRRPAGVLAGAAACLFFARAGFSRLVASFYPALGALCAALMLLLCLPLPDASVQPQSPSSI